MHVDFGYKLFNDEDAFFAHYDCQLDAEARVEYEHKVFGREFRIARVTEAEYEHYSRVGAELFC